MEKSWTGNVGEKQRIPWQIRWIWPLRVINGEILDRKRERKTAHTSADSPDFGEFIRYFFLACFLEEQNSAYQSRFADFQGLSGSCPRVSLAAASAGTGNENKKQRISLQIHYYNFFFKKYIKKIFVFSSL